MKIANRIDLPNVRVDRRNAVVVGDTISLAPVAEWQQRQHSVDKRSGETITGGIPRVEETGRSAQAYSYAVELRPDGSTASVSRGGAVTFDRAGRYRFVIARDAHSWPVEFIAWSQSVFATISRGDEKERRSVIAAISSRWIRYRPEHAQADALADVTPEMLVELASFARCPTTFAVRDFGGR